MKKQPLGDDHLVIAHINHYFFAPTETFIYTYLTNFRRIHPICLGWKPVANTDLFPFPDEDCYGFERPNIRRYTISWLWIGIRRRLLRHEDSVSLSHLQELRLNWAKKILQQRNASLIHAHFGPRGWDVLPIKREIGLPIVTTFYGHDLSPKAKGLGQDWPQRQQEILQKGDLILVEGPFMRQRLIELGCPEEKIQIQRIAIEVDHITFRPRKSPSNRNAIFIFAGRLIEKKGLDYALQAVQELWKKRRNFEFRIIGDGALAPQVRAFIQENKLEKCIKFLGFLNYQDYLREMQQADIFLHPSVVASDGDSEGGAPTVILEAQSMGMPIVSTYHADIPNITLPDKSALLVPERDSVAIADALTYLLDHPGKWEKMGQSGRRHVERFHNIDHEVARLEDKYFSLLQRNS